MPMFWLSDRKPRWMLPTTSPLQEGSSSSIAELLTLDQVGDIILAVYVQYPL